MWWVSVSTVVACVGYLREAGKRVVIRSEHADALATATSIEATDRQEREPSQRAKAA